MSPEGIESSDTNWEVEAAPRVEVIILHHVYSWGDVGRVDIGRTYLWYELLGWSIVVVLRVGSLTHRGVNHLSSRICQVLKGAPFGLSVHGGKLLGGLLALKHPDH